jgi:hypothetical protein
MNYTLYGALLSLGLFVGMLTCLESGSTYSRLTRSQHCGRPFGTM